MDFQGLRRANTGNKKTFQIKSNSKRGRSSTKIADRIEKKENLPNPLNNNKIHALNNFDLEMGIGGSKITAYRMPPMKPILKRGGTSRGQKLPPMGPRVLRS